MGAAPGWYRVLKAAKYLGVAPWSLAAQPLTYLLQAEAAQDAEAHAREIAENRERSRTNRK